MEKSQITNPKSASDSGFRSCSSLRQRLVEHLRLNTPPGCCKMSHNPLPPRLLQDLNAHYRNPSQRLLQERV